MSQPVSLFLANGPGARLFGDILPWLLVLLGIVIAGATVLYFVRRSLSRDGGSGMGFTLQDLRDLHRAGELTDEEFAQARDAMIGRMKPQKTDLESNMGEGSDEKAGNEENSGTND